MLRCFLLFGGGGGSDLLPGHMPVLWEMSTLEHFPPPERENTHRHRVPRTVQPFCCLTC